MCNIELYSIKSSNSNHIYLYFIIPTFYFTIPIDYDVHFFIIFFCLPMKMFPVANYSFSPHLQTMKYFNPVICNGNYNFYHF